MLVQPIATSRRELPALPVDEDPTPARLRGWERRMQQTRVGEQLRIGIALGFGGVLGTALGTTLCLVLAS